MNVPKDLLYTKEHEWIKIEGNSAKIGITDYAQSSLGDVTFVELPDAGKKTELSKAFATVESVKAASDIYAPFSGTVREVNNELQTKPELVNQSPYEKAWFAVIDIDNIEEKKKLLDASAYEKYIKEIKH
ncbi:MAG: glycine cleavage system protein GcvH [Candidatus Omnitrophica bacterium]|nr:glycine cleavage system protein GcvH [Candidatus Omnitrophota bacterium]